MNGNRQGGDGKSDELGRDVELASALAFVDPATRDPNYWLRFESWVMGRAAGELARRRLMADLTVGDVLSAWARTVVPTAVVAALVAGLLLFKAGPANTSARAASVEDVLLVGVEDDAFPAALSNDEAAASAVAFAGERF